MQLVGVATDPGERRCEIGVPGDMRVVHSHVGAEGVQLPCDDDRRRLAPVRRARLVGQPQQEDARASNALTHLVEQAGDA